ncbi:MAG: hypothetical protein ACFFEY_06645 [Candidatus Thorarchaeota archaeon]
MEFNYGKMILHGILSSIFYLVVPLVLIYVLEYYGLMVFTDAYLIAIIIFGIIGVVFSMLIHGFPKDTPANRLIRFGSTVYSGIFLFYVFGGFDPGVRFGTYYIDLDFLQVLLGLRIIAWLLLGSTIIRGLQYLVEAIELRKKREYKVKVKKEFKVSTIFKVLGIIASLVVVGYFGSVIFSGLNLRVNLHDTFPPPFHDDGGTPGVPYTDDTLIITIPFDVTNNGLYAIYDVILNAEIHVVTSSNPVLLPFDTKIGDSPLPYQNTFHSFTSTLNQNINVSIDTAYIEGLLTETANLLFKITFSTLYALIFVNVTVSLPISWP